MNAVADRDRSGRAGPRRAGDRSGPRALIEAGLLALLVASPLPAASVGEWPLFAIELVVALMAAAYVVLEPKPALNVHLPPVLRSLRPAIAGFFGFLVFQILPLPAGLVRILSPAAAEFRELHAPDLAGLKFMSLSLVPSHTFREGLELAAYFLLGFLIVRTVNQGRRIRAVILTLVASGVFQALYGLYELTTESPRLLFYEKQFSLDSVTGTFVNRNHLSGYLEMIIPLAVGLAAARMNLLTFGAKGLRERFLLWTSKGVLGNVLLMVSVVIMSLGVALSRSRSGLFVLVFVFFLFLGFSALAFSRAGPRRRWIMNFVRTTFVIMTALALYVGIGSTIQRFALDDLLHEGRPQYWSNVTGMIKDYPLFGTGLGTFASVYPAYEKTADTEMRLAHAHNDWLEYVAELGVIGSLFLLGGVLLVVWRSYKAWRGRRDPEARGLALGGLVSLAGAGAHALTDFNLHIPANTLLFAVVLSLTLVMAHHRKT
jgi:O-antigen ligase